jgi:rod shape-determining protein MreD
VRSLPALLLLALVTLLLRSTALPALAARGVVLDVLAFATVYWALREGEAAGTAFGFVIGLAADLDAAHWPGRHALILTLIGYAVGRLSHTLVREQTRTHVAVLLIATAVHQAWIAAFEAAGGGAWGHVGTRLLFAAIATAPVGAITLALIRRVSGQPLFANDEQRSRP